MRSAALALVALLTLAGCDTIACGPGKEVTAGEGRTVWICKDRE